MIVKFPCEKKKRRQTVNEINLYAVSPVILHNVHVMGGGGRPGRA